MLDKLKKIKELKDLQNSLAKEKTTVEKDGVSITLNGKLEVEDISISSDIDTDILERIIKDLFNDAIRKIQISMAQKMQGISGLF
jgi:DNA-binding protein YbaB